MARSYRTPTAPPCTGNQSRDRRDGRRRHRRVSKSALRAINLGEDPEVVLFPERNETDNPWDWSVDGKPDYYGDSPQWLRDQTWVDRLARK